MTDRGCRGLASVYSHTSATCGGCEVRDACGAKAFDTLQRVRGHIKVDDLKPKKSSLLGFVKSIFER